MGGWFLLKTISDLRRNIAVDARDKIRSCDESDFEHILSIIWFGENLRSQQPYYFLKRKFNLTLNLLKEKFVVDVRETIRFSILSFQILFAVTGTVSPFCLNLLWMRVQCRKTTVIKVGSLR